MSNIFLQPIYEIPYNSIRRWQLIVARCDRPVECEIYPKSGLKENQRVYAVMMKGAPEVVLDRCTEYMTDDGVNEIGPVFKKDCVTAWEAFSRNGSRVIAFAIKFFVADKDGKVSAAQHTFPQNNLVFLGMAALIDPPRFESPAAIQMCKEAGLKLYMITGDHPISAMAVACRIGLIGQKIETVKLTSTHLDFTSHFGSDWAVVHGKTLESMTEAQWNNLLAKPYIVFAR